MKKPVTRSIGKFARDRKGSPAVEFALVAPLFFLTVFGVFEFGRALYEQNRIASAAAIGARTLVLDDSATNSAIEADIVARLSTYDPNDLTVTFTDETIAGATFKKIEISYDHAPLVQLGGYLNNFTLTATRYASIT